MRPDVSPTPIRLADYAPPAWVAEHVDLTFDLAPRGARVRKWKVTRRLLRGC